MDLCIDIPAFIALAYLLALYAIHWACGGKVGA